MTTTTTTQGPTVAPAPLADLARAAGAADAPEWLRPLREAALERFLDVGIPGPGDEDYRFTRLRHLAEGAFRPAGAGAEPLPTAADLDDVRIGIDAAAKFVFVNGRFVPELSETGGLPAGVSAVTTAEAIASGDGAARAHLGRHADPASDPFVALNTAAMGDGVVVSVEPGVELARPIVVIYVTSETGEPAMVCPRVLLVAGEGASAELVEDFISVNGNDDIAFVNAVSEIVVGPSARVTHDFVDRSSRRSTVVSTRRATLGKGSEFTSNAGMIGGAVVRNNVFPVLTGEDAEVTLNGFFLAGLDQSMDNNMRVEHKAPNCRSRQYYKGILDANARGVFTGRIVVDQAAQKTDAIQSNQNLVLTDTADMTSRPQLEIYADDVRCTHGATTGQLEDEAMFYLRARGMSEEMARATLIGAFARDTIDRIALAPVRDWVRRIALGRLPGADLVADSEETIALLESQLAD